MSADHVRVLSYPMDHVGRVNKLERRIEYVYGEYSERIHTFNPQNSE